MSMYRKILITCIKGNLKKALRRIKTRSLRQKSVNMSDIHVIFVRNLCIKANVDQH